MTDTPNQPAPPSTPPAPAATPAAPPPAADDTGWPGSAKATAVVLALVAVAAIVAAVIGFTRPNDEDELREQADAATERAESAEQERDDLEAELTQVTADMGTQIADLEQERDDVTAERDAAVAERDTAQARVDELEAMFPITANASTEGVELEGTYGTTFNEAYCDGFDTCGTPPSPGQATIATTSEGFLRLDVPGIGSIPLFQAEGALYGIADSDSAAPACGATPRVARLTVTIFADEVSIGIDGQRTVQRLGATLTVDAPAIDTCPRALAFYGVGLDKG